MLRPVFAHRRITPLAVVGLLTLTCAPSLSQEDQKASPAVSIETIAEAWRNRQQAVRTFHFEWDEFYTTTPGALSKSPSSEVKRTGPAEATTYNVSFFLTMDGDKLRFFQDSVMGSPDGIVRQKKDVASVGGVYKHLMHAHEGRIAQGQIDHVSLDHSHVNDPTLFALAMTVRPFSQILTSLENLTSRFEVVPKRVLINGHQCLLLRELPNNASRVSNLVWVDPERDFVVTRRTITVDGDTIAQFDLTEFRRIDPVWIPVRWTVNFLNPDGSTLISRAANVTKHEINHEIDAAAFELEFAPDTYVYDGRNSTDNRARIGGETLSQPRNARKWIVLVNVVAVLLLVTMILWRRHTIRKGRTPA